MPTLVDVANMALQAVAVDPISDVDEESEQARQIKLCIIPEIRTQLESYPWSFAKKSAQLSALGDAPLFRFARAFQLPGDFLRLIEFEDNWVFLPMQYDVDVEARPPYEIMERTIHTDLEAPLGITYIADCAETPGLWSPSFVNVAAMAVAVRVAYTLTKSDGAVKLAKALYDDAVKTARRNNAIQRPPMQRPDSSWLIARRL